MTTWYIALSRFIAKRWPERVRFIPDHVDPDRLYMTRVYLLGGRNHRWGTLALHHVHLSDEDLGQHDHPFPYVTWILSGGYREETPRGPFIRRPGHVRMRSGRSFHRLTLLDKERGAWSLFFMGPRYRNWGFMVNGKWISHQQHLGEA